MTTSHPMFSFDEIIYLAAQLAFTKGQRLRKANSVSSTVYIVDRVTTKHVYVKMYRASGPSVSYTHLEALDKLIPQDAIDLKSSVLDAYKLKGTIKGSTAVTYADEVLDVHLGDMSFVQVVQIILDDVAKQRTKALTVK